MKTFSILQFFEYISKLGATGILIEYEDMFPYHGPFEEIRLPYAYRLLIIIYNVICNAS